MAKKKATNTKAAAPVADTQALVPVDVQRSVVGFLSNLAGFLKTAEHLEQRALETLAQSKTLTEPRNGDEDAALQAFVKNAADDKRQVGDEWGITAIVHRFHRKLTAKRDIAVKALDEAIDRPTRLHNAYVRKEQERVRQEQERVRREAEERERARRQQELDELEAQALEAEAASGTLSAREQQYVAHIVSGGSPAKAAELAGYRHPMQASRRLEADAKIQDAIVSAQRAKALREQAAAVEESPLEVEEVEEVAADIRKVGTDVRRWKAEVVDERLLVEAVLGGKHGIPADVLTVNTKKLGEYARSLQGHLNRWPGVKAWEDTRLR